MGGPAGQRRRPRPADRDGMDERKSAAVVLRFHFDGTAVGPVDVLPAEVVFRHGDVTDVRMGLDVHGEPHGRER